MVEGIEQESPASSDWQDMLDLLGDEETYTEVLGAGLERETLLISKINNDLIVVEHLEPGNIHNVFKITSGGTTAEKMKVSHTPDVHGKQGQEQTETLDGVLKKFGVK